MTLIARDATGRAELAEVVATMTALAELAVQAAVAAHARELAADHGMPIGADGVPQDLLVVGMGKLGGAELNVSSDIDLIFVYDEDGETDGANARRRISNHEFFAQLGRRVIALLNDMTADGFVFRVDMRLRPNGVGGAACGFERDARGIFDGAGARVGALRLAQGAHRVGARVRICARNSRRSVPRSMRSFGRLCFASTLISVRSPLCASCTS